MAVQIDNVNNFLLEYIERLTFIAQLNSTDCSNFINNYYINFDHIKHLIDRGANNFKECANATISLAVLHYLVDECGVNNFAELLNTRKGIIFDYYLVKKLKTYEFINDIERNLFISATNGEILSYYPTLLDIVPNSAEPYVKLYIQRRDILMSFLPRDLCDVVLEYVSYELIDNKHDINHINNLYMGNLTRET